MSSADKYCRYHNEDAVTGCPQCIAGKESAALRDRIAELEARLAAAQKVVEAVAAELPTGEGHQGPYVYVNLLDLQAVHAALAAWREGGK